MKTVMVSGGFDPLHIGHVRMIREAAELGQLTVLLNSDEWLQRKKGYVFMPWIERAEIIAALQGVHTVTRAEDEDGTVIHSLRRHVPDIFANGGDRGVTTTPEVAVCKSLGIEMVFNVGYGGKIRSSSELVNLSSERRSGKL